MGTRILLVMICVTLGGCSSYLFGGGRPETTVVEHPVSGQATPSKLQWPDARAEQQRGLPSGALADEVTLTEATSQRICFDITMRSLEAPKSDLRSWNLYVRGGEAEQTSPTHLSVGQGQTTVYQGQVPEDRLAGSQTYCTYQDPQTKQCLEWAQRPVYDTVWVPGPVEVTAKRASVCFANRGLITPKTKALALRLNASPEASFRGRMTFQWNYRGTPPGAQPQQGRSRQATASAPSGATSGGHTTPPTTQQ